MAGEGSGRLPRLLGFGAFRKMRRLRAEEERGKEGEQVEEGGQGEGSGLQQGHARVGAR